MKIRTTAVHKGSARYGVAGTAGALNGQPFALFGPATVDDRAPALGPHPHQEPVGLLPLPVVWLKSPLHFFAFLLNQK